MGRKKYKAREKGVKPKYCLKGKKITCLRYGLSIGHRGE